MWEIEWMKTAGPGLVVEKVSAQLEHTEGGAEVCRFDS